MDSHLVLLHVEGDIRFVEEVVCEVFLDDIAFVAEEDNKIIVAVGRVYFHDVPENRLAVDFHHRFGDEVGFFREAGTHAACEDEDFHC